MGLDKALSMYGLLIIILSKEANELNVNENASTLLVPYCGPKKQSELNSIVADSEKNDNTPKVGILLRMKNILLEYH